MSISPTLIQESLDASYAVYSPLHLTVGPGGGQFFLLDSDALTSLDNNSDGFFARAFRDSIGNIIIAYEGSDLFNFSTPYGRQSTAADGLLAIGQRPSALDDAVAFAYDVRQAATAQGYGSDPIYVTGHSLGGTEAEAAALAWNTSVAGGFIAGSVTFAATGVPGYLSPSGNNNFLNFVDYGDPIGNYARDSVSALHLISATGSHFGTVQLVGSPLHAAFIDAALAVAFVSGADALPAFLALLGGGAYLYHNLSPTYVSDLKTIYPGLNLHEPTLITTGTTIANPTALSNTNTAFIFAQQSAGVTSVTNSNPHPIITGPANIPALTNATFPIAPFFVASEAAANGGHHIDHYTAFIVRGSGTLTINNQVYALGNFATNISPAQFATGTFNSGTNPGVTEIAVVAFDDLGNSSVTADTTITVTAPAPVPQPMITSDHTAPTIIAPSQQLITGVGSNPDLTPTYLQVADANSAHYTPAQLTYTITSAPSHGYIIKGGSIVSSFTQADVNNHLVEYQENGTLASSDSFSYYVSDPAGNRSSPATFNISINAAPSSTHPTLTTNTALSVGQAQTALITDSNLFVTDSGLNPWQVIYSVTGGPAQGQILADGVNVVTSFTQQQVDLGLVSYRNTGNSSGPDNLTFTVTDSAGGTIGQTTFGISVIPKSNLSVTVMRPVFTDPEGQFLLHQSSDGGISFTSFPGFTTFTNTPGYVSRLTSDMLFAVDPGVDPANITYTVVNFPANAIGILVGQWGTPDTPSFTPFNGRSFTADDIAHNFPHSFTQAELNAGMVFYRQSEGPISSNQEHYGDQFSLVLAVSDNAGNTLQNIVVPVILEGSGLLTNGTFVPRSQIPNPQMVGEIGKTTTVGSGLLTWVSPQFNDNQLTYSVWFTPQHGSLLLNGATLSANATFTQTDIDQGHLSYSENGDSVGLDTFGLKVADPNNPTNPAAFSVNVTMTGNNGGHVFSGAPGAEMLFAGTGSNFLFGDGNTSVSYANSPNGISVDLVNGMVANGYGGVDNLTNIHAVTGSSLNDTMTGGSANDILSGGAGNDILVGDAQAPVSGDITAALQGTIVQFDGSGFDATRVQNASVVKTASGYALLYAGLTFGNNYQVGLATSSDGANWSKHSDNPVISNAGSQSWASFRELPATLMLDNGVYKLWFNGDNSNLSSDPGYKSGFGYATSTDGINWSFDANNPIRVELNSPSGNGIDLDEVVKLNGQYIAYYVNHNPSGDVLNYAVSADGIHFSNDAPLSVPAGYALLAATTANISGTNTVFAVLQDSSGVDHYATSTDGANFTIGGIVNVPSNFGVTDVLFDGSQIKFFGDNGVGNVNWGFGNINIEYATAAISSLAGSNGALGGSDILDGGPGNDTLTGGSSNDTIDGGAGTDTAIYSGLRSDYLITRVDSGLIQIADTRAGSPDGSDIVSNVQNFQFADHTYAFDQFFPSALYPAVASSLAGFAPGAGGWISDDRYPRELADVNHDGMADIVGFGEAGVYVSLATGGGNFGPGSLKLAGFAAGAGGWISDDRYPRELADVNGDHMADIVGFGEAGVYVALATGGGNFGPGSFKLAGFAAGAGGWNSEDHYPRKLADVNGDGMADIVAFGEAGVYVSLATGGGNFGPGSFKPIGFAAGAGGWISDDRYPRELADVNGDHMADIVGFGEAGVYVALATGGGNFGTPTFKFAGFAPNAGGWVNDTLYHREVADVNGDGMADIVGFGQAGVYVALATGGGAFAAGVFDLQAFAPGAGGWNSDDTYPRHLADINQDGAADIVGFGQAGVYDALSNGFHLI
jgi:hypothetical protein